MIVDQVPIGALRKGSTVYVRVLKCGSTFFNQNLLNLGWEITDYYSIDWAQDFVFAHIIDPVVRRHRGLAEYIDMCGLAESYLSSNSLQNLLNSCLFLDRHSMPYSATFHDRLCDIVWIPLGEDHEKNVLVTQDVLKRKCHIDLKLSDWNFDLSHRTAPNSSKKLVELKLKAHWDSSMYSHEKEMNHLWAQLYNEIRDPSWPDAPTAKDFYNLPTHIQQEIATEHQSDGVKFLTRGDSWQLQIDPDCVKTNLITAAHYAMLQEDIDLYDHAVKTFSAQ